MLSVFSCASWPSVCLLWHVCVCSVISNSLRPHGLKPTGFSIHGIFQASIRKQVAISSSRGSSQPREWTCISLHWQADSLPLHHFWGSPCLLWRKVYLGPLPMFWLGCLFYTELHELFIYFGDESFVSSFICKYFLPFWGLSFLVYNFHKVQFGHTCFFTF